MSAAIAGRKVLLGISGGIAAYKGPALVRELMRAGAEVRVVLTRGALNFVTPLSLQAVSHNSVGADIFDPTYEQQIGHIELARWPDVILVAPATAHLIGKIAGGLADDLLTTVLMATTAPVVLAPAMNTQMWRSPFLQDNLERLRTLGAGQHHIVAPDSGDLACQEVGTGRMPDPPILLAELAAALTPKILSNKHVLITAGPTCESIDPVRYITNRSSGKMGYAIAAAARAAGARVTLVSGPTRLPAPAGVDLVPIFSAEDMAKAVFDRTGVVDARADVVIKAAAVADYRPASAADQKIKKSDDPMSIALERTTDILGALTRLPEAHRPYLVGFAAETQNVEAYARAKMKRKPVDLLVANKVSGAESAFGADASSVVFLRPDGSTSRLGPAPKATIAAELVKLVAKDLTDSAMNETEPRRDT